MPTSCSFPFVNGSGRYVFPAVISILFATFVFSAAAQDTGSQGTAAQGRQGSLVDREKMWPAPEPSDWKRPCLIEFQRTWDDAVAISRETGKPILICVNMDDEPASEHYAGIRYRDPEIAKLYEPYVCVIASVYRHNPRDYDEHGNRILCPRFGSVTCGEHIAIETILYQQFFEEVRVAPRHIGVELDGKETYDVYYAFDTDSVFAAIRDGIANRTVVPTPNVRGDRTLVEKIDSRDIKDRVELETAYLQGDTSLRRSLLEAAIQQPGAAQVDLLRLALFSFDTEDMRKLARQALARTESKASVDLIAEALRYPMESQERGDLIAALARQGKAVPRARMLAVVHKGLGDDSGVVDVKGWSEALEENPGSAAAVDYETVHKEREEQLKKQNEVLASGDAKARLELAESFLQSASELTGEEGGGERDQARYLYRDALRSAGEAEKLGAGGWRPHAVIALASYELGDIAEAYARAEAAMTEMPAGEPTPLAMSVLEIFAESRRKAIADTVRGKKGWTEWTQAFAGSEEDLSDLHAAYSVIARHPLANDSQVVAHFDFLMLLEAKGQAASVLDEGLARFPESPVLHDRLRGLVLKDKGPEGLEAVYEALLQREQAPESMEWFAGYASIVAAEFHRRAGDDEEALAAYGRAIEHYERWIATGVGGRETADHFIALALAGRARLACEREDFTTAVAELKASIERKPEAAATTDGLGISPAATSRMLLQRLKDLEREDLAAELGAALDSVDPELLRPPAVERRGPARTWREGPPRRRRGTEGRPQGGPRGGGQGG